KRKGMAPRQGGGIRGKITEFTEGARRRLRFALRNIPGLDRAVCLTYPAVFPTSGRVAKSHWESMRKVLVRLGFSGVWWMEFQKRGAPHFHLKVRGPRLEKGITEEISTAWYRIVASGDPRHLRAGTSCGSVRHLEEYLDYASKNGSKKVP